MSAADFIEVFDQLAWVPAIAHALTATRERGEQKLCVRTNMHAQMLLVVPAWNDSPSASPRPTSNGDEESFRHDVLVDKLLVLINGLPGSGKSTLGRSLAGTLKAQFLSKDIVKEALASCVGDALAIPEIGGIAMDALWALARATPETVVIDSWWFKPRDLHFAKAGIEQTRADRAVEVWCNVPAEVAKARYASRHRAALYQDKQRLANDWQVWAEQAEPLGLTPTVVIDTTRPVDCADLAEQIKLATF